jgi:hypothetical protein
MHPCIRVLEYLANAPEHLCTLVPEHLAIPRVC